jgi:hypothetical protein
LNVSAFTSRDLAFLARFLLLDDTARYVESGTDMTRDHDEGSDNAEAHRTSGTEAPFTRNQAKTSHLVNNARRRATNHADQFSSTTSIRCTATYCLGKRYDFVQTKKNCFSRMFGGAQRPNPR